ncbi:MAG: hypothetical protein ACXWFF_03205 [Methylomonas sp.]
MRYWLWRAIPRLYQAFIQIVQKAWVRRKTKWEIYWQSLTLANKLSLLSTLLGVVYLGSFVET